MCHFSSGFLLASLPDEMFVRDRRLRINVFYPPSDWVVSSVLGSVAVCGQRPFEAVLQTDPHQAAVQVQADSKLHRSGRLAPGR